MIAKRIKSRTYLEAYNLKFVKEIDRCTHFETLSIRCSFQARKGGDDQYLGISGKRFVNFHFGLKFKSVEL